MGSALSRALTRVLNQKDTFTSTASVEFSHALAEETGIAGATYVVSPDTLADKVHSGRGALLELLGPSDEDLPPWAYQVVSNLEKTALPIFTRQQPLTSDTATALRLAALCLAAEADVRDANQLGDTFREIAAGVTLLERRANGQVPPTEMITLAVT